MKEFSLDFPYSLGEPLHEALFRARVEDFIVDEDLGFTPSGEGEHLFLRIRKQDENTQWVADNIARQAGVKPMDVGYCGKKDRFAITSQWFSIYLPKTNFSDAEIRQLGKENPDGSTAFVQVLEYERHNKKLRKGDHQNNRFKITLREIPESAVSDINSRLEAIQEQGVPNYFGEQRFGREGSNLQKFERWREAGRRNLRRNEKSMVISAARSWLFNQVLAQRVSDASWNKTSDGPLWGRGHLNGELEQVEFEKAVLKPYSEWCDALEHSGLSQERRAFSLKPENMVWHWLQSELVIEFSLPAGQFATSVLREIARLKRP